MASNDKIIINKFINNLWQWVKKWEVPAQADHETWGALIDSESKLLAEFEKQYKLTDNLRHMFIQWMNDYIEYLGKESKGE